MTGEIASPNHETQKRILISGPHPLVLTGLATTLGGYPGFLVCGEVSKHQEALQKIQELKPDLVVLDLGIQNYLWLELLKQIRTQCPTILILVVSAHDDLECIKQAIQAGANGYLSQQEPLSEVLSALKCLFAGDIYISRCVTSQLASQTAGRSRNGPARSLQKLTGRELEIFGLTGDGLCARQIAGQLNLGKSTIETYRNRIKEKLLLQDSWQLLQLAIRWKRSGNLDGQRLH